LRLLWGREWGCQGLFWPNEAKICLDWSQHRYFQLQGPGNTVQIVGHSLVRGPSLLELVV
jgi:hypothetical protein